MMVLSVWCFLLLEIYYFEMGYQSNDGFGSCKVFLGVSGVWFRHLLLCGNAVFPHSWIHPSVG
jgi:hypothetical protein